MARRSALAAFAALLLAAAPAGAAERSHAVTDFDRVLVEGPFAVRLVTGRPSAARVVGPERALDTVSISVEGGTLRVRMNRSAWGGYPGEAAGAATVELSTRSLRAATVTGAGSLDIDRAEAMRVQLGVEGNGRLRVGEIRADHLALGLVGGGRLELSGRVKELRANFHGTGDVEAAGLRADAATIVTDTAGRVTLSVAREANVTAGGLGEVAIGGTENCTLRGPGAGLVRCRRSDQRQ